MAAHISAASPNGPRFREELSADVRSSINNGIWLCQNHAKLIDDDPGRFPETLLLVWKEEAERVAREEVGVPTSEAPHLTKVEAFAERDTNGRIIVFGKVNLPNDTKLMISVRESGGGLLYGQDKCAVRHGAFSSKGFSNKGHPLPAKRYHIAIVSYFNGAWRQPESVLSGVGSLGHRLLGPQVRKVDPEFEDSEKYVSAVFEFPVGDHSNSCNDGYSEGTAVQAVKEAVLTVMGRGKSSEPVGRVVEWFLSVPGLAKKDGWSACEVKDGVYEVVFSYWDKDSPSLAKWTVVAGSGQVMYENKHAKIMSYLSDD
ncbi:hypothetical protein J7J47_02295 [Halomonas sp. ISL-60]|uniref:hypothetical protein n=1 Tax=Halomonas sp. ISL-56 TaxID=2819149 RepID=UPI001BE61C50|nr:hypothetical protein [Halomonas sp. ISL-56]MBT2771060.1 hypothetical protein [Halomonas sp. ISL-60]MBT2801953.1 hypothetical protein [Halomonas sp. ISL-56]